MVGWRQVPVDPEVLGDFARQTMPRIAQVLFNGPFGWGSKDLERRLYMVKRRVEKRVTDDPDFYIASLSNLVIVYKGLCRPVDLPRFYPDLADIRMQSAICLFHQRFSTNTLPRWPLAHPFRYLAHNGEINTITGNRQWAKSRSYKFRSPLLPDMAEAAPFVNMSGSDSSSLDNMLELFLAGGMDLFRAFRLLIPPAWQNHPDMDEDLRAFYDFNSMHMEPWDGPAGIVMSDGRFAACGLDRNGLRPARYVVTKDKLITLASEVGIWDYEPDEVIEKGRVGPGELLVIDTLTGRRWTSWDIDRELKGRHPYKKWMDTCCRRLNSFDTDDTLDDRGPRPRRRPAAPLPEALRLQQRGDRADDHGARRDQPGAGGLDGRRRADGGAVRPAAQPLRLFPADVRPGDQPADRPAARAPCHVACHLRGAGAERLRRGAGPCLPGHVPVAGPGLQRPAAAPAAGLQPLPACDPRPQLPAGRWG